MEFQVEVLYRQVVVFAAQLAEPFNDWTPRHAAQGFARRPGSASFRTLDDGPLRLSVNANGATYKAMRVIRVPFEVPDGGVEVGALFDSRLIDVAPGTYELTFEHGLDGEQQWCNLTFRCAAQPRPCSVVLADAELALELPLLDSAEPARW